MRALLFLLALLAFPPSLCFGQTYPLMAPAPKVCVGFI